MGFYDVPIQKNILFDGEDNLVFPSGRSIVNLNIHERSYRFKIRDRPSTITCFNLIHRKEETYILYGESFSDANPTLFIQCVNSEKLLYFVHHHLKPSSVLISATLSKYVKKL
mmetsp:Transcript_8878/g.1272  ORF Transcript_8878/g.1272 Transcript_8878/m.1272 type:complete len:113 (+) Transcript_8878:122-460(+)